jgi:hypothetical protein
MNKEAHIQAMVYYDHGNNGVRNQEVTIQQEENGETTWQLQSPFPEHFLEGQSCITDIQIPDMRTAEEIAQSPFLNSN